MLDWADKNSHSNLMANINSANSAAKDYAKFIRQRVSLGEITITSGARQQWASLTVLEKFFGDDNFKRGLNLLYPDPASKQSTPPADKGSIQRLVALCDCLFNGFCDVLLCDSKYPHKIVMPSHLVWNKNELYIFPTSPMFLTPLQFENRALIAHPGWAQNYKEGRLSSYDELKSTGLFSRNEVYFRKILVKTQNQLNEANQNPKNETEAVKTEK